VKKMKMEADIDGRADVRQERRPKRGLDRAFNLVELLGIFRRRLKLFAVVFGLVTLAALAVIMTLEPRYSTAALVKIDPNNRPLVGGREGGDAYNSASVFVDTEIAVAHSRKVGEAVVRRLNLIEDPEFGGKPGASGLRGAGAATTDGRLFDGVVDSVLGKLGVNRANETYLVQIGFTSADPKKAAKIANAFAEEYIVSSIKLRNEAITAQANALQTGLNRLEQEAQGASASAAAYRAQTGLVDATGGTVVQQQASMIATQLSTAEAELAKTRSELNEALRQQGSGGADSVAGVLNSPVIVDLRGRRAELVRQQNEIATRYGPRHPESLKIQQQLDGTDTQISQEIARVIAGQQAKMQASQAEVASLRETLGRLQGQLASSSRVEVTAKGLERDAQAKQDIYAQYNLAQQQANQNKTLQQPQGVIVSAAVVPANPSYPNKPLFLILGMGLAGMVAGVVVFVAESLHPGILNVADAEEALDFPVLSSIPLVPARQLSAAGVRTGPAGYAAAKPMSAFSEAFRRIRSALVLSSTAAPKVICLTSALPSEGKSVASFAFARVLALGGSKVVIVDCDLRRSSLARMSGLTVEHGLIEVLNGTSTLDQALAQDELVDLSILQLSDVSFSPSDVVGSEAFAALVAELRKRFEFVVLDTPPVLAVADARVVASLADAVLFICRWSTTPRQAAASALAHLEQDGANVAGIVLNMVDTSAKGVFSADDPSYYMKSYQAYYSG
jgi:succinoglycan biosynthesis transport protein ExoP